MSWVDKRRNTRRYDPQDVNYFRLSRSKIDLFIECQRCFYLDVKLGVKRIRSFPYTINSAVDELLKREFDSYRKLGTTHPDIERYGIDARPASVPNLNKWRENFIGINYRVPETNLEIFGAIDDLWIDSSGNYIVCDYKATSRRSKIVALDQPYHDGYKRQLDIYSWLIHKNGYKIANVAYWYYCNGDKESPVFDKRMLFEVTIIKHDTDISWVDDTIHQIYDLLQQNQIPESSNECIHCNYFRQRIKTEISTT